MPGQQRVVSPSSEFQIHPLRDCSDCGLQLELVHLEGGGGRAASSRYMLDMEQRFYKLTHASIHDDASGVEQ